jgi:hypothetical protein
LLDAPLADVNALESCGVISIAFSQRLFRIRLEQKLQDVTYPIRILLALALCVGWLRSSSAAAPVVSAGQVDPSFTAPAQFDQSFSAIAIRPDQRIVAASGNRVQQFHPDGAWIPPS